MPTKIQLEREVRVLKRKLKETEEDLDSSKNKMKEQEEELDSSNNKMKEKEEELDSSRSKMTKQDAVLQKIKDKVECPVCLDVPRRSPVPVCPNGHVVCQKCKKTDFCPTCRINIGLGKSLIAATILENIEHKCCFHDCDQEFRLGDLEEHESVCPHRKVSCPFFKCKTEVSLAKLVEHLKTSRECCSQTEAPLATQDSWTIVNYKKSELFAIRSSSIWKIALFMFCDKVFAIFPSAVNGHFYFVILMFGSQADCAKFKFEMCVHSRDSKADDSVNAVKFHGCPLSVDVKEEDMKLYGGSEQLMAKIFKNSVSFSISFKLAKIENV